jgi:hypothetical protein
MNGTWTTTGRICTDWTPAEDEAVRARARGEIGTAEAARRAGRSPDAVRSRAKRLGLDRPTLRAEADPAFAAKFRALAAEGYGVVAVARLMDLAPVMVRAMSRRLGLPLAGMRAVADGRAEADPAFAAKFRALVLGGATAPDVAAATGVAVVTAYVIARRMGLGWATARSRPAGSVGPCGSCGDPGGWSSRKDRRPDRTAVPGIAAPVCRKCHRRLSGEYGRRKVRPEKPRAASTPEAVRVEGLEAMREPEPIPTPTGKLSDLLAAWVRDTDGGRNWSAPWPQTAANAYHAIEEEEDGC